MRELFRRFQDDDRESLLSTGNRGGQAGDARTNDDDMEFRGVCQQVVRSSVLLIHGEYLPTRESALGYRNVTSNVRSGTC